LGFYFGWDNAKNPNIRILCGFGAHLETISRYEILKERYPKLYDYFMKMENNGVTYREALNRCGIILPGDRGYQTNFFGEIRFLKQ
jgi:hypothetical protein